MSTINSPFRYAGGKFYARKLILEHLPEHTVYAEPFAGGASIFFAKPKVKSNVLNDADKELMNCYIQIQKNVEPLIGLLSGLAATKELHAYYKNEYVPSSDLERAFRWYYLNRTSYSGIMNPVNCYWGYGDKYSMQPKNWPDHLRKCSAKLQGVKLTNADFGKTISQVPDGSFLFVDPPYYNADQDKFYTHSFTLEDHERLAGLLKHHSHRIKFLLTYDNSPEVLDLYSWATCVLEREWNYTINRTDDQKKSNRTKAKIKGSRYLGREVFILNYESPGNAVASTSTPQAEAIDPEVQLMAASQGHLSV